MPRKLSNALTPLTVKNAKPGRHADGGGLYLLVKESGSRSWVFRFMLKGKSRDLGLGPAVGADAVSLAAARDKGNRAAFAGEIRCRSAHRAPQDGRRGASGGPGSADSGHHIQERC